MMMNVISRMMKSSLGDGMLPVALSSFLSFLSSFSLLPPNNDIDIDMGV